MIDGNWDVLYHVAYISFYTDFIFLKLLTHEYGNTRKRLWKTTHNCAIGSIYQYPTLDMTFPVDFNLGIETWHSGSEYGDMLTRFHYDIATNTMSWKENSVLTHAKNLLVRKFKLNVGFLIIEYDVNVEQVVPATCAGVNLTLEIIIITKITKLPRYCYS